jgi:hypothetical protein
MSKHQLVPNFGIFVKFKRCKANILLLDTAGIEGKKMQLCRLLFFSTVLNYKLFSFNKASWLK